MSRNKNLKRAKIVYNGKFQGRNEWLIIDLSNDRQFGNVYTTKKDAITDARLSKYTIEV